MHRPYREVIKDGGPQTPGRRFKPETRRTWSKLPRSTIINFVAVAVLFAVIFALQHVSRTWVSGDPNVTAKSESATVTLAELPADTEAPATAEMKGTATVEEEVSGAGKAAETQAVVELEEEKPQAEAPTPKRKKAPHAKKVRRHTYRLRRPRHDPYWQDKQASVEELDGYHARERYKTLNREMASGTREDTRYQPTYSASTHEEPSYEPSVYTIGRSAGYVDDLDGDAARERYRAENRRLSGPDANLE